MRWFHLSKHDPNDLEWAIDAVREQYGTLIANVTNRLNGFDRGYQGSLLPDGAVLVVKTFQVYTYAETVFQHSQHAHIYEFAVEKIGANHAIAMPINTTAKQLCGIT